MKVKHKSSSISLSEYSKSSLIIRVSTILLNGVFRSDILSLFRTEICFSLITGKNSSVNVISKSNLFMVGKIVKAIYKWDLLT